MEEDEEWAGAEVDHPGGPEAEECPAVLPVEGCVEPEERVVAVPTPGVLEQVEGLQPAGAELGTEGAPAAPGLQPPELVCSLQQRWDTGVNLHKAMKTMADTTSPTEKRLMKVMIITVNKQHQRTLNITITDTETPKTLHTSLTLRMTGKALGPRLGREAKLHRPEGQRAHTESTHMEDTERLMVDSWPNSSRFVARLPF